MKLHKYHGSGNDFIVYDELKYEEISDEEVRKEVVKRLCNRNNGIGADGVLFVQESSIADVKMRIFNADGSEAEMCGNGLRCFSRYIMDEKKVNQLDIETLKNCYRVVKNEQFSEHLTGYEIIVDNVLFVDDEKTIELVKLHSTNKDEVRHLTVSNPHLVINREELVQDAELEKVGKINNDVVKGGINTNYYTVIDDDSIYVKTYERGVGITMSCGTGMISCATKHCTDIGYIDKWLNVYNDGGKVLCKLTMENGKLLVHFVGNATYICENDIRLIDILSNKSMSFGSGIDLKEAAAYDLFFKQTRKELIDKNFYGYKENLKR